MDLSYSPGEQAFEAEVREFLATHLPEDISRRVLARQEISRAGHGTLARDPE
jgi:hypothetical protein